MYVVAKETFNYGGQVKMNKGEKDTISDELAKKLIFLDLVKENVISHKKIKFK
jgi:hypothetical protein